MSEGNRGMQVGEDGLGNKAPGAREEGTPIHFSCPISVVLSQWEAHFYQIHIHHLNTQKEKCSAYLFSVTSL